MWVSKQAPVAVITGATSGIGAAFAKNFARQKYNLIITGRRADKIKKFAQELITQYDIAIEVMILDLDNEKDLDDLVQKIATQKQVKILLNNAGFGYKSNFYTGDIAIWQNMLKVHVEALIRLTYAALPNMLANKEGGIINVSSILAYFPYRKYAVYSATKAFINLFSRTIARELKNSGVQVQVLCPGLTVTDFHTQMGMEAKKAYRVRGFIKPMMPEDVVAKSLASLKKNRIVCIPGFWNKLLVLLAILLRFKG